MAKVESGSSDAARLAFREIRGILRKYGLAGGAHIISTDRAFFVYSFPEWCALHEINEGDVVAGVNLRTRRAEFDSDEAANRYAELTAHVIMQMRDLAAAEFGLMDQFAKSIEKWGVTHTGGKDFSHERDN